MRHLQNLSRVTVVAKFICFMAISLATAFLSSQAQAQVEINLSPQNQTELTRLIQRARLIRPKIIHVKLAAGSYRISNPWIFLAPDSTVVLDASQAKGRVRIVHHGIYQRFTEFEGHFRGTMACIYPLCRNFQIRGDIEFDWNYPLWIQFGRFVDLSCPVFVARQYLPRTAFENLIVKRRDGDEFVESKIEICQLGTAENKLLVVDSGNLSKEKHKLAQTVGGKKLSDRWFLVANHTGGQHLRIQNLHVASDCTEATGGMGAFRRVSYLDCSVTGVQQTTGAAFSALMRGGPVRVHIDKFEVKRCYVAQAVTRFAAIGSDSKDAVDVICKNIEITDNVWVLGAVPSEFCTFLRVKPKSQAPDILLANNTLVFDRCRKGKCKPRLLSVGSFKGLKKGKVKESNTVVTGANRVQKFEKFAGSENFEVSVD